MSPCSHSSNYGLKCEVVGGYSKGYGFRHGDSFRGKNGDHAWNAVLADGKWRLLDCCWGAGYCDDYHHFQRRFTDHQFAVQPEHFVLTHLPEEDRWQLLEEPLTLEEFEETASPKIQFFHLGLKLLSHTNAVLHARSGELKVRIANPLGAGLLARVETTGSTKEKLEHCSLIQSRAGVSTITANFPAGGESLLSIYGRRPEVDGQEQRQSKVYEFILSYTVKCKRSKPGRSPYFPRVFNGFNVPNSYIFSPLSGTLLRGKQPVQFHLLHPTATKLVVSIDGDFTYLQCNDKGEWRGEVTIGQTCKASQLDVLIQVQAKPDETFDPFQYTSVLQYSIEK